MKKKSRGFYFDALTSEYEKRSGKNSQYSIRAFAKYLEIDSSTLSAVLKGKRPLPKSKAEKICWKLGLVGQEQEKFLKSVERESVIIGSIKVSDSIPNVLDTSKEEMAKISADWKYFAIFTLLATDKSPKSVDWIAERLELETDITEELVRDMVNVNLLTENSNGFTKIDGPIHTSAKESIEAHVEENKNLLDLSLDKLESPEFNPYRDYFSSICFTADPDKHEGARKLIDDFRKKMSAYMKDGNNSELYQMNIQLFPLTKRK